MGASATGGKQCSCSLGSADRCDVVGLRVRPSLHDIARTRVGFLKRSCVLVRNANSRCAACRLSTAADDSCGSSRSRRRCRQQVRTSQYKLARCKPSCYSRRVSSFTMITTLSVRSLPDNKWYVLLPSSLHCLRPSTNRGDVLAAGDRPAAGGDGRHVEESVIGNWR